MRHEQHFVWCRAQKGVGRGSVSIHRVLSMKERASGSRERTERGERKLK